MVVAQPEATLLTACANGYGKRTLFGPGESVDQSENENEEGGSTGGYRTQRRGGKGVRDIKTTSRNGPAIGITRVTDGDEIMIMTARGKIQRIAASDINVIGRNTQGVRIMSIDGDDALVAVVRVPKEEGNEGAEQDAGSAETESSGDAGTNNSPDTTATEIDNAED